MQSYVPQDELRALPRVNDSGHDFIRAVTSWGFFLRSVDEPAPGMNYKCLYWDPVDGSYVYFTEDQVMGVAYYGAGGDRKAQCIDRIRSLVSCWTDEEIFQWWDDAHSHNDIDGMVDSVIRLGLTAPVEQDARWSDRLLMACHSADVDVRNAAVVAVGVSMWQLFKEVIKDLTENDPDDVLRQRAQLVLRNWPQEE